MGSFALETIQQMPLRIEIEIVSSEFQSEVQNFPLHVTRSYKVEDWSNTKQ